MRGTLLATASALVVFGLGTLILVEGPKWMEPALAEMPEWVPIVGQTKPVMIILVGSQSGVDAVRKVIAPERIVAEGAGAVALAEGRIIAVDASAASEPLMAAGWSSREIEIHRVPRRDALPSKSSRSRQGGNGSGEGDERLARIAELASKPTLTRGEAMFVLQAIDDGVF